MFRSREELPDPEAGNAAQPEQPAAPWPAAPWPYPRDLEVGNPRQPELRRAARKRLPLYRRVGSARFVAGEIPS